MSRFPDDLQRRCPRLGGPVRFAYCRQTAADGRVCPKILDCWWERFDVATLMREVLSEEDFARLTADHRPPNKVASLIDLIRQARERSDGDL
ncbi:MAG: hypothetical protein EOM10_18260 [Opitutae bacterium]|nr:hypothetical protein [Opitutae bacterium]